MERDWRLEREEERREVVRFTGVKFGPRVVELVGGEGRPEGRGLEVEVEKVRNWFLREE